VKITYDPAKRTKTLQERGLDFEDAAKVFAGLAYTLLDERYDYGEDRYLTLGTLDGRSVIVVWTPHGDDRHIISMRHCHAKEEERFKAKARNQR
jgi:uncharacterized DUF497 family protein